jgi:hypothetical protein
VLSDAHKAAAAAADLAKGKWTPHRADLTPEMLGETPEETIDKMHKRITGLRDKLAKGGYQPPETADAYEFELDDAAQLLFDPQGEADKPFFDAVRSAAHEAGLSVDGVKGFISKFLTAIAPLVPSPVDAEAEIAVLGGADQAREKSAAVDSWVKSLGAAKQLSPDEVQALLAIGQNGHAINALNKLRLSGGERSTVPATAQAGTSAMTRQMLDAMVADPLYRAPGAAGDVHREKTQAAFKAFYPDKAA